MKSPAKPPWPRPSLLLALAMPAAADRLDDVKARGKLVVGVSDTTPPFSFTKPGETKVIGYDLDVVACRGQAPRPAGRDRARFRAPNASRC